jgi:hypothetical protein
VVTKQNGTIVSLRGAGVAIGLHGFLAIGLHGFLSDRLAGALAMKLEGF